MKGLVFNMFDYKETLDKLVQEVIESGEAVGANLLILHKGEEIYHNTFGFADRENNLPIKRDTIFRMFSMTKPVTAAAVMILVERGVLDVWDPVSKYIKSFENQKVLGTNGVLVPTNREITIWDCLNMTSEIPYPDTNIPAGKLMDDLFVSIKEKLNNGIPTSTLEYCDLIGKIPLAFQPGTQWLYGLSADILGGIIEIITGKKYSDFLKEEMFVPLGMSDTGFYVPKDKIHRFAMNYYFDENQKKLLPYLDQFLGLEGYQESVVFESGGAGLVSTIDDYSKFAQMMIHGGNYNGKQILGHKTIEFMTNNYIYPNQMEAYASGNNLGYGYGCLMRILQDQGVAGSSGNVGEFGWDGWTGNYVSMDPVDDVIILYFIQRAGSGTTPVVRKIRNVTYGYLK